MKTFNVVVPLNNQDTFNLDITTQLDSSEIRVAIGRFNYAHSLHKSLKLLVEEMAPISLISQSEAYKEAVKLLDVLEHL